MASSRTEDELLSPHDQDGIVQEIEASLTKPTPVLTKALAYLANQSTPPPMDYEAKIRLLDDEHRQTLKVFLDNRVDQRHFFSLNVAKKSFAPSMLIGFGVAGIAAFFAGPPGWLYFAGTTAYHLVDQGYHQYRVKVDCADPQRTVTRLMKEPPYVSTESRPAPQPRSEPSVSLASIRETLFSSSSRVDTEPKLTIAVEEHKPDKPGTGGPK